MSLYFNEAIFLSIRDFYRRDEGDIFWLYNFLNEETNVVDRNELKLNKKSQSLYSKSGFLFSTSIVFKYL